MVRIRKLKPGVRSLFPATKLKGKATSLDEHVGYRLRLRRSLLGISQERLASSVGITFQQMQKYERGVNRVSAGRLFEFSKLLAIPLTYFFDEYIGPDKAPTFAGGLSDSAQEGFDVESPISENILKKKETLDLVRFYYSIPTAALRKQMLTLVRTIAAETQENPGEKKLPIPGKRRRKKKTPAEDSKK